MSTRQTDIYVGCLTVAAIAAVTTILLPLLCVAAGYFSGWVLAVVFPGAGSWVVIGARNVGINFTLETLPHLGGFLGYVGSFFKSNITTKS